MSNITKDKAYDAVAPGDFLAMLAPERYESRTGAFDRIIAATHDHFWDPLDPRYVDYAQPFDVSRDYILPPKMVMELQIGVADHLEEEQKLRLGNKSAEWAISTILHGEQAGLSLSANLCHIFRDPGAQEYAANQTREEARHVTAFAKYIQVRFGKPLAAGPMLSGLVNELVSTPDVWKKIVGMQMLVEGLTMGAFANYYTYSRDPLLRRLCQLVMTDEAFHHRFGQLWAQKTVPQLSSSERNLVEDWALDVFERLLYNLNNPEQKAFIFAEFGIDWREAQAAYLRAMSMEALREDMKNATAVFRVLIKTLLKTGLITGRTRAAYARYVDIDDLSREREAMAGEAIAAEGLRFVRAINAERGAPKALRHQ